MSDAQTAGPIETETLQAFVEHDDAAALVECIGILARGLDALMERVEER